MATNKGISEHRRGEKETKRHQDIIRKKRENKKNGKKEKTKILPTSRI